MVSSLPAGVDGVIALYDLTDITSFVSAEQCALPYCMEHMRAPADLDEPALCLLGLSLCMNHFSASSLVSEARWACVTRRCHFVHVSICMHLCLGQRHTMCISYVYTLRIFYTKASYVGG